MLILCTYFTSWMFILQVFITNIIAFSDFFLLAIFCISPNRNQNNVHNIENIWFILKQISNSFLISYNI